MPKSTLIDVYTLIASVFNTTTLNVGTSIFTYLLISLVYRSERFDSSNLHALLRSMPTFYTTLREIPETSQLFLEIKKAQK
jgi:hypothetical protein